MQRLDVIVCPFWIDLEAQQVAKLVHLFSPDFALCNDPPVGRFQGCHSDDGFDCNLCPFVSGKKNCVVAFEFDADFVLAGHLLILGATA
ncbi:MAG: hypothetical protein Q8L66_02150 [Caulobacter sp.]|nr:hypothetical protein [Caulobacter sp.]